MEIKEVIDSSKACCTKRNMNNAFNEITEICPHCESEITMQWRVEELGYKAYCPVCGKLLMLCSACHDDTGNMCDYDSKTDSCKFNPHCAAAADTKKET